MKLAQISLNGKKRLGILTKNGLIDAAASPGGNALRTMEDVILGGEVALKNLRLFAESGTQPILENDICYLPCVTSPEKILCVGLNYVSHTSETKSEIPKYPVLFNKYNNALAAHHDVIRLPSAAEKFDYEAELVVVIGRETRDVTKEEALSCVFGYAPGNDLSARDLQSRTPQWMLGKTCDGFAPVGPFITTADEINPQSLKIECRVNGELRQSANTRDMIFDCATVISYVSRFMTLKPGDILFTGTPAGVILGMPKEKQQWLKPGDEVRVTIEKLGSLTNVMG
ncbi:FAA hydrolase family protein [Caproiciproducens sp. NJN-50]|uniref:fumarylacetoacetate hydrolase family protein n=1 Tax=Acutalibacteraceae TaxID=3082771 RepID=UPI000FFE11EE|nr:MULTISPECIES: fumarylacetoacetate hydrolase family protein [Acutalibacteraceae]QAT50630.1 FAA hydrolase family protein [Caproiciproducens sp. NJN-50]